jgi:hypothetical protein
MTRKIKIFVLVMLTSFLSSNAFSQIGVSYYSSYSKLGVSYDFSNKVWGEFRLNSNGSMLDLTPELVLCRNFVSNERYNIYAGVGGVLNRVVGIRFNNGYGYIDNLYGIVIPVGVQFTPFEKLDRFSLHLELMPTIGHYFDTDLQTSWGLRYKF